MGERLSIERNGERRGREGNIKPVIVKLSNYETWDLNAINLTNVKKKLTTSIYGAIHLLDALFPLSIYNIVYFSRDNEIFLMLISFY